MSKIVIAFIVIILILIYYYISNSCKMLGSPMSDPKWLCPGEYFGPGQTWLSHDGTHKLQVTIENICIDNTCNTFPLTKGHKLYLTLDTSGMLSLRRKCGLESKLLTRMQLPPNAKIGWSTQIPNIAVLADVTTNTPIPIPNSLTLTAIAQLLVNLRVTGE